jgi:hypothetical protein
MTSYHLEILNGAKCNKKNLEIFGRAHYSYINQIFGDQTVRDIIQEIMQKEGYKGTLIAEPQGEGTRFGDGFHHIVKFQKKTLCSANSGYQNNKIDKNDNLCQSYSLLNYLKIPFDKTPAEDATVEIKRNRQMAMIDMYRVIIIIPEFVKKFTKEVVHKDNNHLWEDSVDNKNVFYIIEKYKKGKQILENIEKVLDAWEDFGWMYFIEDGKCQANITY